MGEQYRQLLIHRSNDVANDTVNSADPNLSIVIRTRNECARLESLLNDIHAQKFSGEVQVIIVDSDSSDGTQQMARKHGAQAIAIHQASYSHPRALNIGFEAADHPYIMALVGHSNLVTTTAFKGVTRWVGVRDFAAAYGPVALPDNHATDWERRATRLLRPERRLSASATVSQLQRGAMLTHRTVYAKAAWEEFGGFNENYGAGGEDKAIAQLMLNANLTIVREPILSIYHSHHLGLVGCVRQYLDYRRLDKPHPFDARRLRYRRLLEPEK